MKIQSITAIPLSCRIPEHSRVSLGVGKTIKRDTIIVRLQTDSGVVGYGESHAGRSAGAVLRLIEDTLSPLAIGMSVHDVTGFWKRVHKMQFSSHGLGGGAALALGGIDMAMWDARSKAVGLPLYAMLGGERKRILAYAGGNSLGYQPPAQLAEEAQSYVDRGFKALKLRVGDTVANDVARIREVRKVLGEGIDILIDANTAYTLDDVRRIMPALEELGVGWLEEPFACNDFASYRAAAELSRRVPIAAGENHFTLFDFAQLVEARAVSIWQPDLSKSGGITECLRIASVAAAWRIPVHAHSSITGINHAATLHFMSAIENSGYYEACVAASNPFRTMFGDPFKVDGEGYVIPGTEPGIGLEIDEDVFKEYPAIGGAGYVFDF